MNKELKNSGFIEPVITPEQYVLGAGQVPLSPLKTDSDWSDVKHVKEYQNRPSFDTYNCTGFNTLNQIEQYMLVAFGELHNYSDRWLGIIAGTKPPGNDPQTVYEAIREYGLIPEEMLPFIDDIKNVDEYYSFKGGDREKCYAEGRRWKEKYAFKHEWVFEKNDPVSMKISNMQFALKYSSLAIAVYAWATDDKGVYVRRGPDIHWTSMYALKDYMKIFDSYDPIEKDVDQEIYYCKRIHMEKKPLLIKTPFFERFAMAWRNFLAWLQGQRLIFRAFKIHYINYSNNKKT